MSDIPQQKQHALDLLKIHYGFDRFRPGQEKVIDNILAGLSTVVIMPTGGGKSLCYQLPALVLPGVTIVISPLIALMKDQVDALERIGIPAVFINSSITPIETQKRIDAVRQGAYKLLYVAPERFYSKEFFDALKNIEVSLFAIDEAHCISQWGHDFRPSYMRLKYAIKELKQPTVLALTATATPEVKEDIIRQLELKDPELVVTGFARPNLQFGVVQAKEGLKPHLALDAVQSAPDGSGIIYVSTRTRVDDLVQFLLENNIEAAGYHAGMDNEDRKWVQENFLANKFKVIVATNAFGLGIDKPDIRFVVHYDMPGTIEAYYQEAGRAGRDGKPSFCLLLYNSRDRALHEFFIKGENPSLAVIRDIYAALLDYGTDTVMVTYADLNTLIQGDAPDMAIGTSIKILEKEGFVARSQEKKAQGCLRLLKDTAEINAIFSKRSQKSLDLLADLEKRYGAQLRNGLEFNAEETSSLLKVKKDSLIRLIKKLVEKNAAEYSPPFKGTEIKILKRVEPCDLAINASALQEKLNRAYGKLDQIESYIFDIGCRQKFILNYFGDLESLSCGKCDSCLTINGYQRKNEAPNRIKPENGNTKPHGSSSDWQTKSSKSAWRGKHGLREAKELIVNEPERTSGLSTKLTQLETLDLHLKGRSTEQIAEERGMDIKTVEEHLLFLKKKKILK